MDKFRKNGTLPMVVCALCFIGLIVFSSSREFKTIEWPVPLIAVRFVMAVFLLGSVAGFAAGYRKYKAWKKAETEAEAEKESKAVPAPEAKAPRGEPAGTVTREELLKEAERAAKVSAERAVKIEEQSGNKSGAPVIPKEMLDDVSFIAKSHHTMAGAWHQYDYLLAARGYGWSYMVSQADYMAKADLMDIGTVTTAEMANMKETELIEEYREHNGQIADMPSLRIERGQLAIGGMSRTFSFSPIKIVWFNQTKCFRIFAIQDDDELLLRYAESIIRRTFNTPDAMKLAKPVPETSA